MSVVSNNILAGASGQGGGGYEIERSLRFNASDSSYLSKTPSAAGNRKTWTWSGWIKRNKLGSDQTILEAYTSQNDTGYMQLKFRSADSLSLSGWNTNWKITSQVFRDVSAWLHLVVTFDATQATGSDRIKFYVNGAQITDFATDSSPSQNTDHAVNNSIAHYIGYSNGNSGQYADFMLAEVNLIDGTALDPTSFGAFDDNGVWQAINTAGLTFGTNGFRLKFADNSGSTATTLGKDTSGNSSNFTPNNLSVAAGADNDSLVDSPINGTQTDTGAGGEVVGNYATLNPLNKGSGTTLSNGNLDAVAGSSWTWATATIGVTSGKFYWEVTKTNAGADNLFAGIAKTTLSNLAFDLNHANSASNDVYGYTAYNGNKEGQGSSTSYGANFQAAGDVIGVALDMDAGTLTFYKNGVSQGQAFSGITDPVCPAWGGTGGSISAASLNFGQRAFAYTAPSGYKSLNTANLPEPTIADGSLYFDTKLWTGTGSSRSVTGYSFSPDWVWIKKRSGSTSHNLFDAVRGANKPLFSNSTSQELSDGRLTAFNSDGFTLDSDNAVNDNNQTHVGWAWDAGTSTVTNNDGSIASQVRAQPSAGFSIVGWSGQSGTNTVGHGLNAAPELIILKGRTNAGAWVVGSDYIGWSNRLELNTNAAASSSSTDFNSTAPTSSVFTAGSNQSSGNKIAYCFAPVAGYSAIGSFSPNGTTDNAFVYTGFRTKFILAKFTTAGDWMLLDTSRRPNGPTGGTLIVQDSSAEDGVYNSSQVDFDFLSNGFKIRHNGAPLGDSGKTVIYYAVAENPFKYSRAY